jgi:hypothetical protein
MGRRVCDVVVTLVDLQIGDGIGTARRTPVAVAGLSSGVVMVAAGGVRMRVA